MWYYLMVYCEFHERRMSFNGKGFDFKPETINLNFKVLYYTFMLK